MFGSSLFGALPIDAVDSTYQGSHKIRLVEGCTNAISIPALSLSGVESRLMRWDNSNNTFVSNSEITRISEFIRQINKRYLDDGTINNTIIVRCIAIDADTLDTLVFTPGATIPGSSQDFGVIISDQEGGYESRGFTIELQNNANGNSGIDGGEVILRLSNNELPW